jgi:hypothetical protein
VCDASSSSSGIYPGVGSLGRGEVLRPGVFDIVRLWGIVRSAKLRAIFRALDDFYHAVEADPKDDKPGDGPQKKSGPPVPACVEILKLPAPSAEEKTSQRKHEKRELINLRVQWGILVAVAGYTLISYLQLIDTKKAFIVGERAWVAPVSTGLRSEPAKVGSGTIFVVPYTNTGKTLALHVRSWINRTDIPHLQQITDSDPIGTGGGYAILPPGSVDNTSTSGIPITESDVKGIKRGAIHVFIYGTISYDDIFGKSHWTQFCFYPGPDLNSFGPCDRHNRTDDPE